MPSHGRLRAGRELRAVVLTVVVVLVPAAGRLWAWHSHSHEIAAKAAIHSMPADTPEFFRLADEEIAYVCNDPDRWRANNADPTLRALDFPNHWFQLERSPGPLPKTRYEFVTALSAAGKLGPGKGTMLDYGTAPYAIVEHAEMLTETLRLWRRAPTVSARDKRWKRQIEQNVLQAGGLLCHYLTDIAQPLHASIHLFSWNRSFPNPKGYKPADIHRSIESFADDCVSHQQFTESHVARRVTRQRPIGDWMSETVKQIQASNKLAERVYALEQKGGLKRCAAGSEGAVFIENRLAVAAALLRDVWHSAWVKSGMSPAAEPPSTRDARAGRRQ